MMVNTTLLLFLFFSCYSIYRLLLILSYAMQKKLEWPLVLLLGMGKAVMQQNSTNSILNQIVNIKYYCYYYYRPTKP